MLKFTGCCEERKELARRVGELTGNMPMYMRAPTYAYECGSYTIDRDGNLLVDEESADAGILTALMNEGLIAGGEVVGDSEETSPAADEIEAENTDVYSQTDETTEAAMTADSEFANEEEHEDAPQTENVPSETEQIDMAMNFPLPMSRHTGTSLRNLVFLLYSRGPLISKATGGEFRVDAGLVEALKDDSCTYSKQNFLVALGRYEEQHGRSIHGLTITPEEVTFTGFHKAPDMEHLTAYGHLAVLINEQAISQKRVQPKIINDSNEKYALRIWLVRIGMGGDEFKTTRKVLMRNLEGHTAFRTPEDAEKFRIKAQAKRDALKAAKEATETGTQPFEQSAASEITSASV